MTPGAIHWALGSEHRRDMLRTADQVRLAAAGRSGIARRISRCGRQVPIKLSSPATAPAA
jgi:hypothetical protein